jgi:hypothetical protein
MMKRRAMGCPRLHSPPQSHKSEPMIRTFVSNTWVIQNSWLKAHCNRIPRQKAWIL